MGLKVSKSVILPRIDKIQDPEAKRVIQELLRVIQDINANNYSDLVYLEELSGSGALTYEDGTWTMGVSFGGGTAGITYSYYTGYYTKIGNIITISGFMMLTSKGTSTGSALITGLPFTVVNNVAGRSTAALALRKITFEDQFQGYAIHNTKTIQLEETTKAGVQTALTNADFANDSTIMVNCTYRTE